MSGGAKLIQGKGLDFLSTDISLRLSIKRLTDDRRPRMDGIATLSQHLIYMLSGTIRAAS